MSNNDVLIKYVLDRSGSMINIWEQTISGFNEFKNEQARQEGKAYITLTAFDQPGSRGNPIHVGSGINGRRKVESPKPAIENIYDVTDASEVVDILPSAFSPRGMTPLLDAIGISIEDVEDWLVSKENKDFDGKVLFVVNTDGLENASVEFTVEDIKKRIAEKEKEGWEFVFMGAGIDAVEESSKLGFSRGNTISYDSTPQSATMTNASLSSSTSSYRRSGNFSWDEDDKSSE